jgi:hypothetical protein
MGRGQGASARYPRLGSAGSLDPSIPRLYPREVRAVAAPDLAGRRDPLILRCRYDNAPSRATPDCSAYEREIIELVESVRKRGLGKLQVTLEFGRIFDILRRHHIQARSHMTMVNLALMTAVGLGRRLVPERSLPDAALPYLAEALGVPLLQSAG